MKKHVLIGSVLLAAVSAFSQNSSKLKPTGLINTKILMDTKYGVESAPTAMINSGKPTATPVRNNASKTTSNSINWQIFASSMNIYGVVISYCKPLQWDDDLNAVSFVHRVSPTYDISPTPLSTAQSGGMVAEISTNCGATWDSTALYANDNYWGRYPGGAIYNPPGNTSLSNAYIVGAGPTTGPSSTTWIGNWYASKSLSAFTNTPSAAPGAQQVITTAGPYPAGVPSRHDFAAYGFSATDDGKMRVLAGVTNDQTTSDTAVMLMTGTFNTSGSKFDWAGKVFQMNLITTSNSNDNTDNWVSRPMMAWNESGQIGYVVIMGSRQGRTHSNVGFQPIVFKTSDYGVTWTELTGIDFNTSAYNDVKAGLWGNSYNHDTVPNFYWGEGIDCSVDMNNNLHIFSSILAHASAHPDSLNYINQFGAEKYLWPHTPGNQPYLWDFSINGTSATPHWSHMLIDSMSSEGPAGVSTGAGYTDNPWDQDPTQSNQKVRIDSRIQMSRTPDGKQLIYSWAESDTAYTDAQKKWNTLPNIKARLYDVTSSKLSTTKVDLTSNANGEVASRAMYHFISPKFKLVSTGSSAITVALPVTCSNSNPYSQLTKNHHWYSCAQMDFALTTTTTVGIAENSMNLSNSSIYPNPARNNAVVNVSLQNSAKVQIEVLNTVGQVVKIAGAQGQAGSNSINVDLSGLSSGVYFVNIKADNASTTKKLIIE